VKASRPAGFLRPLLAGSDTRCALRNQRNGRLLAQRVLRAFDSRSRRTGLLDRTGIGDEAMIIAPTNLVHTWFMRFAIDIAFVARNGTVLKTYEAVPPWRIAGAWGGFAVIELRAGALAASGTVVGDVVAAVPEGSGGLGSGE
jgi:uncharacterized membrane protein (UPF0127 family)